MHKPVLVWILCIRFLQHWSPDYFSKKKKRLDFRDVLRKILYLLAREQMRLDGLIFYNSVAFCRQGVMKPKVKYTASSVVSDCFRKPH